MLDAWCAQGDAVCPADVAALAGGGGGGIPARAHARGVGVPLQHGGGALGSQPPSGLYIRDLPSRCKGVATVTPHGCTHIRRFQPQRLAACEGSHRQAPSLVCAPVGPRKHPAYIRAPFAIGFEEFGFREHFCRLPAGLQLVDPSSSGYKKQHEQPQSLSKDEQDTEQPRTMFLVA